MPTVLVAHGDRLTCELLAEVLGMRGYDVVTAVTRREVLVQCRHHRPHLTLLDCVLGESHWSDVLTELRAIDAQGSVILLIEGDREPLDQTARDRGAVGVVSKGQGLDTLFRMVDGSLAETALNSSRLSSWTARNAVMRVK